MAVYQPRVLDAELASALGRAGAVLIEGPRASGKTATASHVAGSAVHLDRDAAAMQLAAIDPGLLLEEIGRASCRERV